MKILDEFIQEVRKFGQKKAARLSGVNYRTIIGWCGKEHKIPNLEKAVRVADVMGLEFLLFDKE